MGYSKMFIMPETPNKKLSISAQRYCNYITPGRALVSGSSLHCERFAALFPSAGVRRVLVGRIGFLGVVLTALERRLRRENPRAEVEAGRSEQGNIVFA